MILPGFPVLLSKPTSGSIVFPAVTVGRANINTTPAIGVNSYGYIRAGGIMASAFGVSGGTLSGTLVPGFVTDAVVSYLDTISVIIQGNCEALLSGITAMMDNGTPLPLDGPFVYDGVATGATISVSGWSATGNRTVQLV